MKRSARPRQQQPKWPWQLPELEPADVYALQAIERGEADTAQQLRFWDFLQRFCGCGRMSFYAGAEDGRRATDFAEGKRFIGDQMRRLARLVPTKVDIHGEPPPMPGQTERGE